MSVVFGPVAGGWNGLIGHTLKILPRMVALGGAGLFVQELLVLFLASLVVKWIFNMVNLQQMTWCVSIFSQAFGNIVVWGLIAPSLDILIYSEPIVKYLHKEYSRLFQMCRYGYCLEHC